MAEGINKIIVSENEISNELLKVFSAISSEAISARGRFMLGLSGGSMVKFVCNCLPSMKTDWDKWHFFFCEESLVPLDHPQSLYLLYKTALIGTIPVTEANFVHVDFNLSATEGALDYEAKIRKLFPNVAIPAFDVLLLGLGLDGHTAALYPGHPLLEEKAKLIAGIVAPPKPKCVTMTFPVINNARNCLFIVTGAGKADIVKRTLVDKEDLPPTHVKPDNGQVYWILDNAAASKC